MGDCFKRALEMTLSMQQYSQKYNMILFNYIFYKWKWGFVLCFFLTLLDLIISFGFSIQETTRREPCILLVILTIYLITALCMMFIAISWILFYYKFYDGSIFVQFFAYNQFTIILYFVLKMLIIFIYIPDGYISSEYMDSLINQVHFQVIWGLISIPQLIKGGLLPCLINLVSLIITGVLILFLFPGFWNLHFYRVNYDELLTLIPIEDKK